MNIVQNKKLLFGLLLQEISQEIIFNDRLVTNRALLDYKKGLFSQVAILEFFQRADPMNLVQNKKLLFGLLLQEISQEIIFDDRLVTNRDLLHYKKGLFGQVAILEFFQRGDPMKIVQN